MTASLSTRKVMGCLATTAYKVGFDDPYGALLTEIILRFSDSVPLLKDLPTEGLLGLCRNSGSGVRRCSPKVWRHWEGGCKSHHIPCSKTAKGLWHDPGEQFQGAGVTLNYLLTKVM